MRRYSIFFAALFFLARPLAAAADTAGADAEARRGLNNLQQYITERNYKDFGLSSAQEISQLRVEDGVDVFYVLNDDLKNFHSGSSLAEVVRPSQTRFYPVLLKEEGKFLITVRYREGKWQFASFEETDNAYNMVRLMSANKFIGDRNLNLYAIEIPALHLSYATLSKPTPGKSMTLLALNRTSFQAVKPGENPNTYTAAISGLLDAKEVFGTLSEKARKIVTPARPQ